MSFAVPTEDEEQRVVVEWLELVGLRFTHVAVSTYTTSWKQKSRNHYLGLRPGFPDLIVIVPSHRSVDGLGHLLCPELKRRKGGQVSQAQHEWIDAINAIGSPSVEAKVCRGAQEAMDFVNQYLRPDPKLSPF